jgi:hypothetical protein
MEEHLLQTIELKNGLTLEIFDASIKITADRYKVVLVARIAIDVADTLATADLPDNIDSEDVGKRLTSPILFEQKKERFFVGEKEKQQVLDTFCSACLNHADAYFSRKDFPVKFLLKTYREANP